MVAAFEVIAEPNRRRILDLLRVDVRVDAQRRVYSLRAEPLREIDAWLAPYRELWVDRLDDLARHLDDMPDED